MIGRFFIEFDTAKAIRVVLGASLSLIVLAVFPFTPLPALDIKLLLVQGSALVLSLLLVWQSLQGSDLRPRGLLLPLLAGFVVLNLIASFFSSYPGNTVGECGRLVSHLVIFLAASRAYGCASQLRRLFLTICLATALASVYGFLQRLGMDPLRWAEPIAAKNLPATFGNSNLAGHVLVVVVILCSYLALAHRSRLAMGLLPLFLAHQYLTHHRAGLLALFAAIAFALTLAAARWAVTRRFASPRRVTISVGILLAIVAGILAAGFVRLPLDGSLLLRYNSLYSASRMAAAAPVLGFGAGNYVIENVPFWTEYQQEQFARGKTFDDHPHCEPLYAACSAGLPAMGLLLAFFIVGTLASILAFSRATSWSERGLALMFAAFFCGVFVDSLFGFNLRAPASGALIAAMAGCFEGTYAPRNGKKALPLGTLALCVTIFYLNGHALRMFGAATVQYAAQTHATMGAFESAEKQLARAEALDPANWRILQVRASMISKAKRAGAAECLEASLRKNPMYINAMVDYAEMSLNLATEGAQQAQNMERARQLAQQAIALCPVLPEAWDVLARSCLLQARLAGPGKSHIFLDQAEGCIRKSLACGAANKATLRAMMGEVRAAQGDLADAEKWFVRAAADMPPDALLWPAFYQLSQKQGTDKKLYEALRRSTDRMSKDIAKYKAHLARAYLFLGTLQAGRKDPQRACATLGQAASLSTSNQIWRQYFAAARGADQLDVFFEKLKISNPQFLNQAEPALHIAHAQCLSKIKGVAFARSYLSKVLSALPFDENGKRALQHELSVLP